MKINWHVRLKNINFWLTLIPSLLLVVQLIADIFGIQLDLGTTGEKIRELINVIFVIMATLGVINDPTTASFSDSTQAMTYTEPRKEATEE